MRTMDDVKLNCWEFKRCGREPGGMNSRELGVCPAASETRVDGANGGHNGGRACWAVAGTLCGGKVQGTYAMKMGTCGNSKRISSHIKHNSTHTNRKISKR